MRTTRRRRGGGIGLFIVSLVAAFIALTSGLQQVQAKGIETAAERVARYQRLRAEWSSERLWSSMGQDPQAVACIQAACTASTVINPSTGRSAFEARIEACKSAHLARAGNAFAKKPDGPAIRALAWTQPPKSGVELMNACPALRPPPFQERDEPAYNASLAGAVAERVLHVATALKDATVHASATTPAPVNGNGEGAVQPKKANKDGSDKGEKKAVASRAPKAGAASGSAVGNIMGDVCPMPEHIEFRAAAADHVEVFVLHGADYTSFTRSACWTTKFKVDAKSLIEANRVEDTIPYCLKNGMANFDADRYNGSFTHGEEPRTAFFDECTQSGGTLSLALQERQRVSIERRVHTADPAQTGLDAAASRGTRLGAIAPSIGQSYESAPQAVAIFRYDLQNSARGGSGTKCVSPSPPVKFDTNRPQIDRDEGKIRFVTADEPVSSELASAIQAQTNGGLPAYRQHTQVVSSFTMADLILSALDLTSLPSSKEVPGSGKSIARARPRLAA